MTNLSQAQKSVLLSIKDGTTPPFKGAPLANITRKVTELGFRNEDGSLTEKGYEALGIRPLERVILGGALAKGLGVKKLKHGQRAFTPTPTRPEGAIPVRSTEGIELGFYVPYEWINDNDNSKHTFYRTFVCITSKPGGFELVSENSTSADYASKRIVAEYNKRHSTRFARGDSSKGQSTPQTGTNS